MRRPLPFAAVVVRVPLKPAALSKSRTVIVVAMAAGDFRFVSMHRARPRVSIREAGTTDECEV
jgi:hypothetical protein